MNVLDLFAGPGGWDQGARMAGYSGPLVGIEMDMSACRTAVAAGHARVCADVATYPVAPFTGRVDGLIASPPCQSWSNAGDRKGEMDRPAVHDRLSAFATGQEPAAVEWRDDRSKLAAEPMRWVHGLRPRWIALEQVPPVLPLWQHMAVLLRGMGYRTWTGILSAEEYGVPQTRKRAILIARRDGLPVGPPVRTHQPYRFGVDAVTEPDLFGDPLPPPVSMADALGWGLPHQPSPVVMTARGRQAGPQDALRGSSWRHEWFQRQIAAGNWVLESSARRKVNDRTQPRNLDDPSMTVAFGHSDMQWVLRNGNQANACARALDEPAGTLFFGRRTNAVDWVMWPAGVHGSYGYSRPVSDPSPTIKGAGSGGQYVSDGEQTVRVTIQEAGVLQSFPADYPWQGTKSAQYRQVGDAVPPMLAAAILRPLIAELSGERAA